jgi:putative phosphotransacetylase
MEKKLVPVGLSNRHVHLSQEHVEALFGKGYELTKFKDLGQPGQYACNEKIEVVGPKGSLTMRVLGPARKTTQIEVSLTDGFVLGVKPPVRDSGDLAGSPGCTIKGPEGEAALEEGIIAAARHIHMHTSDAERFGLKDKDRVSVKVEGERGVVFNNVLARAHETYALEFHLDIDEGNAAGLKNGMEVEII